MLLVFSSPPASPAAAIVQWFAFLAASIAVSLLGFLMPAGLLHARKPRSHHALKTLNECIARHQLAYFSYFYALSLLATFTRDWVGDELLKALAIISLVFYWLGLQVVTHQDDRIAEHHRCGESTCSTPLPFRTKSRLLWANLLFTVLLLSASIYLTLQIRPE